MNRRQKQMLVQRYGGRTLRRRLALQLQRHADWYSGGYNSATRPMNRLSAFVGLIFRLTGLYYWGHRQFHNLKVTSREVYLKRLPSEFDGFRILHLSDLHLDLDRSFTATLCKSLQDCNYDICVITGDFRNYTVGDPGPALAELKLVMEVLPQPVYGVLGNHDSIESVPELEELGVRMLLNEHTLIVRENAILCLAGVDDPNIYQTHRLDRALKGVPKGTAIVLLSHSPQIHLEAAGAGVDLVLAGHLHGGQICLPGGHILLRNDMSPRKLWRGSWKEGNTLGYTSRGTGACGVPLRFFSPPEAVVHILKSDPDIREASEKPYVQDPAG